MKGMESARIGSPRESRHTPVEKHWYDDFATINSLPPLHRACGLYCWAFSRLARGRRVRGARALMVRIAALSRALKLRDTAMVRAGGLKLWVDLHDPRILFAMDEAMGIGDDNRLLRVLLKPGDTFLDIGANHGTYALNAATAVGKEGRVIAFEPQPKLAALIRKSFESNDFSQGEVLETACSDTTGQSEFYIPLAWSGEGSLYRSESKARYQRVTVHLGPLDELLADHRLPGNLVLKVDTEGSEVAVLRGAQRIIAAYRPYIHFEISPQSAKAAGHSSDALLQLLGELNYTRFAEVDRYPDTVAAEQLDRTRQRNLLAIP